ncbi:MAG: cysteine desulfurase family protein [Candidatus Krumholzibacteriia bacterium]
MPEPIYLDHNASTPLCPAARAAMQPLLEGAFGNPSSDHWAGRPARAAVERARDEVAALLGAAPDEIVFTSGGSEGNNAALAGVWRARGRPGARVIISAVEHPAVVEPCRRLAAEGARVVTLPVDGQGRVDPSDLARELADRGTEVALVSIMHANNETGALQPVAELARRARAAGALFHTDAAQSCGKVPVGVDDLGVDLLSLAGHKLYGPKGIGALYVRRGTPWTPLILGAAHERGRRAGTESALLCAGLGSGVVLLGPVAERLPNTLCVGFRGLFGGDLLASCPELAASTGAACHAGGRELSATLRAMGVAPEIGLGAVRLSLGRDNTAEEVARAAEMLSAAAGARS